jgi:hypothetical protein
MNWRSNMCGWLWRLASMMIVCRCLLWPRLIKTR